MKSNARKESKLSSRTLLEQPLLSARKKAVWPQIWSRLSTGGAIFLLLFLSALFLIPFIWLFITALKTPADMGAFPIVWWPSQPQWQNFALATTLINFWTFAGNSFLLSAIQSVLVTLTSAMVGFGFARLQGWGKRPLFLIMLATLMLPSIVGLIPTYIIFSQIGFINTYWPWVVWGLASSPFLSFLFRQFFTTIPKELEEAAIVDGCGYLRIFAQIFLPISLPVIATSLVLSFSGTWGDWLAPELFLNPDNTTLGVALSYGYTDPHGAVLQNVLAAGCILYIIPMLVVFFVAQRYFTRGIVTTGLK
jgi:multiple sugar transport system permease protein